MKILIAEDNQFYRSALEITLREWNYDVVAVADGKTAWDVLREPNAPKLAILDWMMPGLDGLEVCRRVRGLNHYEPTYVIILTAKNGKENFLKALEHGADDYITKPFDREELRARLRVGQRIVGLQTSQAVIYAFAQAVDMKSKFTMGHSDRVTRYAVRLAEVLGLPRADRDTLRRGGILHDIGKINVPDAILDKPGPLTPAEHQIIKRHPLNGVAMVEGLESLQDVVPLIRWHHERIDGRGYPDRIAGAAIPPLVRILSVADVYDALSSERPYRGAMPHAECLRMLRSDAAGGGLDPELVERFCALAVEPTDADRHASGTDAEPRTLPYREIAQCRAEITSTAL
jgi:putative two-component system response regulator